MKQKPNEEQEIEIIASKQKRHIRVLIIAVTALVIVTVTMLLILRPEKGEAKKVIEALRLGEKYLSELEYEQAIASYELAIQIDPKCADAYLGLADVYLAMDQPEEAAKVLARAEQALAEGGMDKKTEADLKKIRGKKEEEEQGKATPEPTPTSVPTPISSGTGGRVTFTGNTVEISKARVGDTVRFGSYEQDNNLSNGAEAIEWLVLDKQDGKLLLLSKDALDCKMYNERSERVTWETCTLRNWLNGTFYNTAFSTAERGRIATTKVKNGDNPYYNTEGGNDTEDKVFLLSIGEVLNYFDSDPAVEDPARRAKVTAYAEAQGGWVSSDSGYAGNGWWWLRSPGDNVYNAANVGNGGYLDLEGFIVISVNGGVRPAFWLNLES